MPGKDRTLITHIVGLKIGSPGRIRTSDQPVNRGFPQQFAALARATLRRLSRWFCAQFLLHRRAINRNGYRHSAV
jgi:hypothetical protein